jgi:hypothetical protein
MKLMFTEDLNTNIGIENVEILSTTDSVNSPEILTVVAENDILDITFRPIFEGVKYQMTLYSTISRPFESVNGNRLIENGSFNSFYFISPGETSSAVRDDMLDLIGTTYNTEPGSLIRELVSLNASQIQHCADELATIKSANYISVPVVDELMTRGDGPVDNFTNGGVFGVSRVGSNPTGAYYVRSLELDASRVASFKTKTNSIINPVVGALTDDPISLQFVDVIGEKVSDNSQLANFFSGLNVRVANGPIAQVVSVFLLRNGTYTPYDLARFGYIIQDNRYDTLAAGRNVNLGVRDLQLSTNSLTGLSDGFLEPQPGDVLYVSYVYKNLGRNVDPASVVLSNDRQSVRESTPPIITRFTLDYAPIVLADDTIPSTGGVTFYNTQIVNGQPAFSTTHPAFLKELVFGTSRMPARLGEYTVNYLTGEVFVYGATVNNGTGSAPPAATYYYRKVYAADVDYTYDSDLSELAIKPNRQLEGQSVKISFNAEDVFAPGTDYNILSHVEALNERVQNRLTDDFTVQALNWPITNVFRIFNETTGEIYTLDRFNDSQITFTGRNAPRQKDITTEPASFLGVSQEILYVAEETTNSHSLRIFTLNLQNNTLMNVDGSSIGANFDTSVTFTNPTLFAAERFFEDRLAGYTSTTNINRLQIAGEYVIDYKNGVVYVAVSSDQSEELGEVSYLCGQLQTHNTNILKANNVFKKVGASGPMIEVYELGTTTESTIQVLNLDEVGERFIENSPLEPLVVGTIQGGTDAVFSLGSDLFGSISGVFDSSMVGLTLTVGTSEDLPIYAKTVIAVPSANQLQLDSTFSSTRSGGFWSLVGSSKVIALAHDIAFVKAIYTVDQLGTVTAANLTNCWNVSTDSFSGNTITLGAGNTLTAGQAVVVDYNFGSVFADYLYLQDEILISYEYGNNCLDWSISSALNEGDQYYVTYNYGALRDSLLANFGSLTQVPQLTTFSPNVTREEYRSIVAGTLQSFIAGPTKTSMEKLVKAFTGVEPEIDEAVFDTWTLGQNFLTPVAPKAYTETYDAGKFGKGLLVTDGNYVTVPAISHLKLNEGTIESWVKPMWAGKANDAILTFDLSKQYSSGVSSGQFDLAASGIYVGFMGRHPLDSVVSSGIFTLSTADDTVKGEPEQLNDTSHLGYFIWFDENNNEWNLRWKDNNTTNYNQYHGSISSTGTMYDVTASGLIPTDSITTTANQIAFDGFIDSHDSVGVSYDGFTFRSDDTHYLFDSAAEPDANRISIYKDPGYLHFRVIDQNSKQYILSHDVSSWAANEQHHVAASWRINSEYEQDQTHLFIDGQEVPNLYKYGGPDFTLGDTFGSEAREVVIESAARPIVGGFDGQTTSDGSTFVSLTTDFAALGIHIGDYLYILEPTADGTQAPNNGAAYTINGVGDASVQVDGTFSLTMGNLQFSVNRQTTIKTNTPVEDQRFIVLSGGVELNGINAESPDYSIARVGTNQYLSINNGVASGDMVEIRTLGLTYENCKERFYMYGDGYQLRTNSAEPTDLSDVSITKVLTPKELIAHGVDFYLSGGKYEGSISNFIATSNGITGRRLSVCVSGDNIDFTKANTVTITGETSDGLISSDILDITQAGSIVTTDYWFSISLVAIVIYPLDPSKAAGVIEIKEALPLTESDGGGEYAQVFDYANGRFDLRIYGSGGLPFVLTPGWYELDYSTPLRLRLNDMPEMMYIGASYDQANQFQGVIDEFGVLNTMLSDIRTGEDPTAVSDSITADYNSLEPLIQNANTLLLLHFNDATIDDSDTYDRFDSGFEVGNSVNANFDSAIKLTDRPYVISNATSILNNNAGTIEFWANSMDDSNNDDNLHFYVDACSEAEEVLTSTNSVTLTLPQRASSVQSVFLAADEYNDGTNYFTGGSVSNVNAKLVTLGTALPNKSTSVKVVYTPINAQGDRLSIYRSSNALVFYIKASGTEYQVSVPINWARHSWHRVMVMWTANSVSGTDRMRLFVDGSERGTIKYGTGLIYGTGVIYGQAEVRAGQNRFIVSDINLTDTLPRVFLGTDIFGLNGARALLDNIRFSNIERLSSISQSPNEAYDINYVANTDLANPVQSDSYTTKLLDFDTEANLISLFAKLIDPVSGIFLWNCKVIDSFNRVKSSPFLKELLTDLINTLKASHTSVNITFE